MIRIRTLAPALICATALLSATAVRGPLAWSAEDERVPLTAVDYDTIWTISGNQLVGTIVSTQADGAVRFDRIGRTGTVVPKAEIQRIERKQTLTEAISRRGDQAITAGDWLDVQRVLHFVIDKKDDAKADKPDAKPDPKKAPLDLAALKDAGIAVGRKALAQKPTVEVAALTAQLLWDKQDLAGVVEAAQSGLKADPNWTAGYEYQAKVFLQQKQDDKMRTLVKAWLDRQPTAFQANRYMAGLAESAGDFKVAAEAYRKGFDLHQDLESALGYARCSLKKGDRDECARAAKALIDKGQFIEPAKVWLGSALLRVGSPEADTQAQADLEAGLAGKLDDETADVAHYNLGILLQRAGKDDEARRHWTQVKGRMGAVALARLDRKPISADGLPPTMAGFTSEYNAAIELENKRWQSVLGGAIDTTASQRAVFLAQVANLLKSGGSDETVHNLAATAGDESLRWQAYGLLIQGRFKDVEVLLDRLPPTDGWAIATRVYIASARKDEASAQTWLKRLDGASNTPKQYAQILVAEFASANDEVMLEGFDWPDGEAVATGWEVAAPGTNITVHAKASKLVLEGAQLGSDPTCAYKLVAADRLRSVEVKLELGAMATATGGLELSDDKRENGLQIGASGGRVLWRSAEKSQWGPWNATSLPAVGDQVTLRIELDKGRLALSAGDANATRVPVTAGLGHSEHLAIGIFGVAEQGTNWTLTADDLSIQLRPVARR